MAGHHLEEEVVVVVAGAEGAEGEMVEVQCYSVGVHAVATRVEGQVFQAVAVVVAEEQAQLADQREEVEAEAVQLVQRK